MEAKMKSNNENSASRGAEIPFWFQDKPKWVSGIGRGTTCTDILLSLVKNASNTLSPNKEHSFYPAAHELCIIEQWKGVERALNGNSKILKLWLAWGEERDQVRFVVKPRTNNVVRRTCGSMRRASTAGSSTFSSSSGRRLLRRGSTLDRRGLDTVHPSAIYKRRASLDAHNGSKTSSVEIERLMRLILSQGETIRAQLQRLQEREGIIESIEHEVHDVRMRTSGKNYLLNAYYPDKAEREGTSAVEQALNSVIDINEQLQQKEEMVLKLTHSIAREQTSKSEGVDETELSLTERQVVKLAEVNADSEHLIASNHRLIAAMRHELEERKALVARLELDVQRADSEQSRLRHELRQFDLNDQLLSNSLGKSRKCDGDEGLSKDQGLSRDAETGLLHDLGLRDVEKEGKHQSSTMGSSFCTELRLRMDDCLSNKDERLKEERLKDECLKDEGLKDERLGKVDSARVSAALVDEDEEDLLGHLLPQTSDDVAEQLLSAQLQRLGVRPCSSSGTSSSSSGRGATGSPGSLAKTPDLPVVEDVAKDDSNDSDTGLSSLHSSSDEGTYVLDTLV